MFAGTTSNFTTTVSSPASSQRPGVPQNKRSFLGLRRLSGAFDTNIRYSNEDSNPTKNDDDVVASPRPLRPFSPVGGLISSFKPRSRTSSLNTGTTATVDDAPTSASGGSVRGLRKKKSASWFRRRMSGMPLGVGVETVEEGQIDGKGDSIDMDSIGEAGKNGFRHGGYVTDLEKKTTQDEEEEEEGEQEPGMRQDMTPPPQLPDLGSGMGEGHFAGDDSGLDLFGSIR